MVTVAKGNTLWGMAQENLGIKNGSLTQKDKTAIANEVNRVKSLPGNEALKKNPNSLKVGQDVKGFSTTGARQRHLDRMV